MTTKQLAPATSGPTLELGAYGRRAAQAAAGLTVGSVVTLGVFFAAGEPWGSINDAVTIALSGATVPIAIGLARRNRGSVTLAVGAALDVVGFGVTAVFTSLLISRRMTFEGSLPYVLAGQGLIGAWMVTVGAATWSAPGSRRPAALGIVGGGGLIVTVGGFAMGGITHPLAAVGFVAGLIGTLGFYALLGRRRTPFG